MTRLGRPPLSVIGPTEKNGSETGVEPIKRKFRSPAGDHRFCVCGHYEYIHNDACAHCTCPSFEAPKIHIYALVDPRDEKIRYIGQSVKPKARLYGHWHAKGEGKIKNIWVNELRSLGLRPTLRILETVHEDDAHDAERRWVTRLAQENELTNGNLYPHPLTKEARINALEAALRHICEVATEAGLSEIVEYVKAVL